MEEMVAWMATALGRGCWSGWHLDGTMGMVVVVMAWMRNGRHVVKKGDGTREGRKTRRKDMEGSRNESSKVARGMEMGGWIRRKTIARSFCMAMHQQAHGT